jgi:hypothetical protein
VVSEYKSPHNDGHDPYILIWEYGNDAQRAEFSERWATFGADGRTIWHFRLVDGGVMTFSSREWEQKDDVNHLTTIHFQPTIQNNEKELT